MCTLICEGIGAFIVVVVVVVGWPLLLDVEVFSL